MSDAAPAPKRAREESSEDAISPSQIGILQLNNMTYKLEPDLAVVVQRNVQSSFFLSQSYTAGSTMTCIVNSGSGFVNLRQSYLVLDVTNSSTANAWFGLSGGSAANFINRIQIVAKNGVVLERIDNANVLAAAKVAYAYDNSWINSVGSLMGIAPSITTMLGSSTGWATGAKVRFIIPLYIFSTFCDSMNSLCPAQLLAGARFEILLESASAAMIGAAKTDALNYSISACRIDFETYLLTDSVMSVINQVAASTGLEVVSATTQDTQSIRNSTRLVVDVARSCSRALSVLYKERYPKSAAGADGANGYPGNSLFDSMASAFMLATAGTGGYINVPKEWQIRAGQLYFPQTSIRGDGTALGLCENELYQQSLRAFQKLNLGPMGEKAGANVSLTDFRGATPLNILQGPQTGKACFALDLQRSAILTSGIPLSNSRQLSITYDTNFVSAGSFLVDVYLTYQILVRTFLSQVVLEV